MNIINKYLCACAFLAAIASCKDDRWDEHARATGELQGVSLKEAIQAEAECSAFYAALVSTGYDTLLASANSFTVFVPSNSAWQQAMGAKSIGELRVEVANHIAYDKRLTTAPDFYTSPLRMFNGKMVRYDSVSSTFNSAAITSKDRVAANGVFHLTDAALERRDNVWDYIYGLRSALYPQVQFLKSATVNRREMDMGRSVQVGVNGVGQPVYDTVWADVNDFLKAFPLNDETKEWTYVVLQSDGFDRLFTKYRPYFAQASTQRTDSLTYINVCRDFVFEGRVNIALHDTLANADGVKVPLGRATIAQTYEASNGRVYVINESNILLREKIKPVMIEGEAYNPLKAADPSYIFTRYKLWASGDRDVMLAGRAAQTDTMHVTGSLGQDSTYTVKKTFLTESSDGNKPNVYNSYVEYKAPVYAVSYEIHYVAYDDIASHFSDPLQTLRIEQKLFASMPGRPALQKGTKYSSDAVANSYMTDRVDDIARFDTCFVAIDTAGIHRERKMRKWTVSRQRAQAIQAPVSGAPQAYIMSVPTAGEITLWLCNTARDKDYASQLQGFLFLDYIKLVPILEDN